MWWPTQASIVWVPATKRSGHVHLVPRLGIHGAAPLYSSFTFSWHAQGQRNERSTDVTFASLCGFILIRKFLLFNVLF